MLLHYLVKWKNAKKLHFPSNALLEFNQMLDFFNVSDSRLIPMQLYDSLSHAMNAFRDCWVHGLWERKMIALQQLDCVTCTMHCSALSSGFSISQGNSEALDRWDGKTKHHMILYFPSNISAKNYRNRIVHVNIIASRRWDVFWYTVYMDVEAFRMAVTFLIAPRKMINTCQKWLQFHTMWW